MQLLIITSAQVRELLPMDECIDAMESALKALRAGEAVNPLRTWLPLPENDGSLIVMPSYVPGAMGVKMLSLMPHNHGTAYDSHMGAVMLFEAEHGRPLALMEAGAITAIRTAAVSGAAARALANPDAGDLAILGSGVQARSHLQAMSVVRNIRRARVWSRTAQHAAAFVEHVAANYLFPIEAVSSIEAAVSGADIICTATGAREPILHGDWVSPGAHLNVVGASSPTTRECDTSLMERARLFVDRRESVLAESGDFLIPKSEGAIDDYHIQGELGEVLLNIVPGRGTADEITLFKSLGLAIEDLAAAQLIYAKAVERGVGAQVDFS